MRRFFADPLQQSDRTSVLWRGRKLVYFAGCDYFRLSSHPEVLDAARNALGRFGLNVAASRRTTGNHTLFEDLENATRKFFKAERAILVSSGYLTNLVVAQGLENAFDRVLIDARAHSSLRDASRVLSGRTVNYPHRDPGALARKRRNSGPPARVAVLTDGMFAHDGSIAPLKSIREAVGDAAVLWVDDAHAAGVLGRNGRGTPELSAVNRANTIQTITFSKAFGGYGGAILCNARHADLILNSSAALAGNTPIPLPVAAASLAGLRLCQDNELRNRLWRNVQLFWSELGVVPQHLSPIIPVTATNPKLLTSELLEAGIHPPLIQYGSLGEKYFRFALSSEHESRQLSRLARVLRKVQEASPKALLFPGLRPELL